MNRDERFNTAAIRHIRAFLNVARYRSFTRAAKELHLSQPALTMAVRQLEDFVGASLFDRTTRMVSLTPEGTDFLPTAERLIADFDLAIQDVRTAAHRRRGNLALASVPSVAEKLLPAIIRKLSLAHPTLRVRLRDGGSTDVLRRVRRNEADVGICTPGGEESELAFAPLFEDELGIIARFDHDLAALNRKLFWRELDGYDFVGFPSDTATIPLMERVPDLPASVAAPRYEVNTYALAWQMVAAGNGITAAAALAVPAEHDRVLRFCRVSGPTLWRSVCIVTRRDRALTPVGQEFVSRIRSAVAEAASQFLRVRRPTRPRRPAPVNRPAPGRSG